MSRLYLVIVLSFLLTSPVIAQDQSNDPDTSKQATEDDRDASQTKAKKKYNPTKAAVLSAVVPGLGQAYNKKYWKIPIIYLAKGFLIYQLVDYHQEYTSYRDALYNRQAETVDPENDPYPMFNNSDLRLRKNSFRESRDNFIVYLSLAYILQILDAAVDAHLQSFKVGEELILSFEPNFSTFAHGSQRGLSLNLRF